MLDDDEQSSEKRSGRTRRARRKSRFGEKSYASAAGKGRAQVRRRSMEADFGAPLRAKYVTPCTIEGCC